MCLYPALPDFRRPCTALARTCGALAHRPGRHRRGPSRCPAVVRSECLSRWAGLSMMICVAVHSRGHEAACFPGRQTCACLVGVRLLGRRRVHGAVPGGDVRLRDLGRLPVAERRQDGRSLCWWVVGCHAPRLMARSCAASQASASTRATKVDGWMPLQVRSGEPRSEPSARQSGELSEHPLLGSAAGHGVVLPTSPLSAPADRIRTRHPRTLVLHVPHDRRVVGYVGMKRTKWPQVSSHLSTNSGGETPCQVFCLVRVTCDSVSERGLEPPRSADASGF